MSNEIKNANYIFCRREVNHMEKTQVIEKAKEVIAAPSCCPELKEAAQNWIDAVGTDGEKKAAEVLIAELKEDVLTIDSVIEFSGTDAAAKIFGAETAAKIGAHAKEVKAAGGEYCDCPACSAGKAILDNQDAIL